MKSKISFIFLAAVTFLALSSINVLAQQDEVKTYEDLIDYVQTNLNSLNGIIPEFVKKSLGSNVIQFYVKTPSGTDAIWAETSNGNVQDLGFGRVVFPSPTVKIETSKSVVDKILQASDKN